MSWFGAATRFSRSRWDPDPMTRSSPATCIAIGALAVLAFACSGSGDEGSPGPTIASSLTSSPTSAPGSITAVGTSTFSKDRLTFRYPADWDLQMVADGPGVASGCGREFWVVSESIPGQGLFSVSR